MSEEFLVHAAFSTSDAQPLCGVPKSGLIMINLSADRPLTDMVTCEECKDSISGTS